MGEERQNAVLRFSGRLLFPFLLVFLSFSPTAAEDEIVIKDPNGEETVVRPGSPRVLPQDENPIILKGSTFSGFLGSPLDQLGLFRFDPGGGGFVPIPFQIDQRIEVVLNPGSPWEATEHLYDVQGLGSGVLETDDEVAFLFTDAGTRAPLALPWPENAGEIRYEVAVSYPQPGKGSKSEPPKWIYLFSGPGLPLSPNSYVAYTPSPAGSMTTSKFAVDYQGNWIMSGLRILPSCGSGADLIDRLKGRALTAGNLGEDEVVWSFASRFYGGKAGPVRAIRVVLGAASGVSTLLQDIAYRGLWEREIHLRVHAVPEVRFYFDWLPGAVMRMYTASNPLGVTIDGTNDSQVGTGFQEWVVVKSPRGGAVVLHDLPDSPYFGQKEFFYRDDASWNDELSNNPYYWDDDDLAFGVDGVAVKPLLDSNPEGIFYKMRLYPLCGGQGDASLGASFKEAAEKLPEVEAEPQLPGTGSIRSLEVTRDGADTVLTWDPFPEADFYRVYHSPVPSAAPSNWHLLAEALNPSYRDISAGVLLRYYSVVFVVDGEMGGW